MTFPLPLWMQAEVGDPDLEYSGLYDRAAWDMIFQTEGVIGQSSLIVSQRAAGANFSVDVSVGDSAIKGDTIDEQGTYLSRSATVVNVAVPGPPVSGTRTHRVVKQIRDNLFDSGGLYDWTIYTVEDTTGTGTAEPDSAITLAFVEVTNGQTSVLNANITDARPFASGVSSGTPSVPTRADLPGTGVLGQRVVISDLAPISMEWDGSGWRLNAASATIYKDRDSDLTRSATGLLDDTLLVATLLNAVVYKIEALLIYTADASTDLNYEFTVPSGGSLSASALGLPAASTGASGPVTMDLVAENTGYIGGGSGATVMTVTITGRIWSGSGGAFALQWAPNAAAAATLLQNSYLYLIPVAI